MRDQILAEQWLTTADAAKVLERSSRTVRRMARSKQLPCEHTRSGQALFRAGVVVRFLMQRAEGTLASRQERLAAVRTQMLKVGIQPRQLSLFGRGKSERPCPQADTKRTEFVGKRAGVR